VGGGGPEIEREVLKIFKEQTAELEHPGQKKQPPFMGEEHHGRLCVLRFPVGWVKKRINSRGKGEREGGLVSTKKDHPLGFFWWSLGGLALNHLARWWRSVESKMQLRCNVSPRALQHICAFPRGRKKGKKRRY